jgi:hypothetical protein
VNVEQQRERLRREGYDEAYIARALANVNTEAARADWQVLPPLGWSIDTRGGAHHITPGALTGERTVWHYVEGGPYLPVPEELLTEVRHEAAVEAHGAALRELQSKLTDMADELGVHL